MYRLSDWHYGRKDDLRPPPKPKRIKRFDKIGCPRKVPYEIIKEWYDRGEHPDDIAKHFKISLPTIYRAIK